MGFPQISSGSVAKEVAASLSTLVQNPPTMISLRSCDMSAMHGGNMGNQMQVDIPGASFGEFQRITIPQFLKESDCTNMHNDDRSSICKLKINSIEQIVSCLVLMDEKFRHLSQGLLVLNQGL